LQAFVPIVSSVFLRHMLQECLSGCSYVSLIRCKAFYLNVSYICNGFKCFLGAFTSIFRCMLSVSCVFKRMLQVLHLNISKVNRVLHML
jgi:hypothetical protein